MTPLRRTALRFLCSLGGSLLGLAAGTVAYCLTCEHGAPFSWFLPLVFAAVFSFVSFVVGERFLLALVEILTLL